MLSLIKKTLFNISVLKYLFKNPKALKEIFITLNNNALYGDVVPIVKGYKEIDLVTLDGFLKKNNIKVNKNGVEIPHPSLKPGSIRPLETQAICTLVKGIKPKSIFEIGTYMGRTTKNISHNIDEDGKIFSLCLPQEKCSFNVGEYVKHDEKAMKYVNLLSGDSAKFDFSPYYNKIDLMFIDGDHSHDYTISDTENAIKCVKNNGFIIWHDFNVEHLGNSMAIYELSKKYNLDLHKIDGTSLAIAKLKKQSGSIVTFVKR